MMSHQILYGSGRVMTTGLSAKEILDVAAKGKRPPPVPHQHSPTDVTRHPSPRSSRSILRAGAYTTARTIDRHRVYAFEQHATRLWESLRGISGEDVSAVPAADVRAELGRAMSHVIRAMEEAVADESAEFRLTAFVAKRAGSDATRLGDAAELAGAWRTDYLFLCHGAVLPEVPQRPVRVLVCGSPRKDASVKSSAWVHDRAALERRKAQENARPLGAEDGGGGGGVVDEVVLVDEDGHLVEGTQTNFFATRRFGDSVGGGEVGSGEGERFVLGGGSASGGGGARLALETATEGMLEGTVRATVLEVAEEHGIPLIPGRGPSLLACATWSAAFISSTSRLALPVHQLIVPADQQALLPPLRALPPSARVREDDKALLIPLPTDDALLLQGWVRDAIRGTAVDVAREFPF
jgi:branched-subunit amino acid aminotransferase/4-amino-4-deoxychorismate lyase